MVLSESSKRDKMLKGKEVSTVAEVMSHTNDVAFDALLVASSISDQSLVYQGRALLGSCMHATLVLEFNGASQTAYSCYAPGPIAAQHATRFPIAAHGAA